MKICCIDIGTNSVICLIANLDSLGRLTSLKFQAETTRLGKNLRKTGYLIARSQRNTVSVISKYLKRARADKYIIAGTSALREAKNSEQFARMLYKKTGQRLKILSEPDEANLAFISAKHFLNPLPRKTIICDIGGGSAELIFCLNGKIINKVSIPIGAVNLTEKFNNDIEGMESFIKSELAERVKSRKDFSLIGIGGTVTSLGAILKKLKQYDPSKVHKQFVTFDKLVFTLNKLHAMPLNKRRKVLCFAPKRADIIVAGLCILKVIMQVFSAKKIRVCDRGLAYGLAVKYFQSRGSSSIFSVTNGGASAGK